MRAVDWLARVVLMVLASLATLALIGSLASVSNTPLGAAFPGRVEIAADDPADPAPAGADAEPGEAPTAPAASAEAVTDAAAVADRRRHEDVVRWLKALTYAVLALAGFAAAGVVALTRIAHHLGRIAGR